MSGSTAFAPSDPIPLDAALTHGELDNGLKYFVLPNEAPANRICISFVVKVGTAHEMDGIRETKYLSSVEFEHTVFSITVPCDDTHNRGFSALSKTLQWISGVIGSLQFDEKILAEEVAVLLSEVEVEKDSGSSALTIQASRLALDGTPYANRQVRGNSGDVASATVEKVKAFYTRYYHPQNSAVIIVGDFKKYTIALDIMNKYLASIPEGASGCKINNAFKAQDMKLSRGPLYGISRSSENKESSRILIEFRVTQAPNVDPNTMLFLQNMLADEAVRGFLRQRIASIAHSMSLEEPVVSDKLIGSAVALVEVAFTVPAGNELPAFRRVVEEIERMRRFGATKDELDDYRSLAVATLRPMMATDDSLSEPRCSSLLDRFCAGHSPIHTGPRLLVQLIDALEAEHLVAAAKRLTFESAAVFVALAEGSTTKDVEFNNQLESVTLTAELPEIPDDIQLGAVRVTLDRPLPPPGSFSQEDHPHETIHQYELNNGMFVLLALQPLEDEEGELEPGPAVSVSLSSNGGHAEVFIEQEEKFVSAVLAGLLASTLGLGSIDLNTLPFNGGLSPPALNAFLFERSLSIQSMASSPAALELLFTVLHDIFTSDDSKWAGWTDANIARELAQIREELRQTPQADQLLDEHTREINWNSSPLIRQLSEADLDKFDVAWARKYLRSIFEQPSQWKLQIALRVPFPSDANGESLKEHVALVEGLLLKYLGSIPSQPESARDASMEKFRTAVMAVAEQIRFQKGVKVLEIFAPHGDPERAMLRISVPLDNLTNALEVAAVDFICLLLEAHFFELMRDTTAGNVDSVSVVPVFPFSPIFPGELNITFTCEPQTVDSLLQTCLASIKKLSEAGPSKQQINQSRQLLMNSPSQLSGLAENLNPDGTTLFGMETYTNDITKVMTPERARDLIRYMLHMKSYTAIKLFSDKLEEKRKAGKPLIIDEEDSQDDFSEDEESADEEVPQTRGKPQVASKSASVSSRRQASSGSATIGVVAIGLVVAVLGAAGFFYFKSRRSGNSK